ncbi:hypothetical protein E2562_032753 [Oryza meyeriana var. granulata]|uniref:DUF834 domain-containing protein n=1 Tax=Oryza meyeriana var. granulata TaxID=110450 RepID=A0A6G1E6F6_9ORYZ|nr:hypothetical protein E2562_032753 [Oryza meyeriana var. granulata]
MKATGWRHSDEDDGDSAVRTEGGTRQARRLSARPTRLGAGSANLEAEQGGGTVRRGGAGRGGGEDGVAAHRRRAALGFGKGKAAGAGAGLETPTTKNGGRRRNGHCQARRGRSQAATASGLGAEEAARQGDGKDATTPGDDRVAQRGDGDGGVG